MKKSTIYMMVLLVGCFLSLWIYISFVPMVTEKNGLIYDFRPGGTKSTFVTELTHTNQLAHPFLFSVYAHLRPSFALKSGEYFFPKGSTATSIWKQLTTGTGHANHPFTIIPGWTFNQLRQAILKKDNMKHQLSELDDKQIMQALGYPDLPAEGQFLPETYFYTKGMSDKIILKRAFNLMQKKLNEAWAARASDLPYANAYEALIAASVIEKEAYLNAERPVIASVLVNRLQKNMLLQFDPTVIYGMGARYNGSITKQDLREDTPYNSYIHKGLPPTPISMPSMASILAALHPIKSNYFYFVAKGDGSHQFSQSLKEHNVAVVDSYAKRQRGYFNEIKIRSYLYTMLNHAQIGY